MRLFLIGLVVVLFLLLLVKLTAEGNLVTDGAEYARIEDQVTKLKQENLLLRDQIYQYSSFTTIAQEASASGFISLGDPIYLPQ